MVFQGGTTNTSTKTFNSHDPVVVPVMLTWAGGGHTVYVTGTFNNWRQKICLSKSTTDFSTVIDLPPGATHRFKFIVGKYFIFLRGRGVVRNVNFNFFMLLQIMNGGARMIYLLQAIPMEI